MKILKSSPEKNKRRSKEELSKHAGTIPNVISENAVREKCVFLLLTHYVDLFSNNIGFMN